MKPINSLLIKPAGPDCNYACRYCFYLKKSDFFSNQTIHRMSTGTLEELIRQAMIQSSGPINFCWQGGEPTLMGLAFFEKAIEFQKKYGPGKQVGNGLQTNGLLLDGEWLSFLKRYRFLVGLSLDGPEHVHDRFRTTKSGAGTWKQTAAQASRLLEYGVSTNAMAVVNPYSVRFPEEIYNYIKSLGFSHMQFIPAVQNPGTDNQMNPDLFGNFLITLYQLWRNDFQNGSPSISVRFFDSLFFTYVDMTAPDCTLMEECGRYLVIEHDGSVFSCDFFVEPAWKLGNVRDNTLLQMINSEKQQTFGKLKTRLHQNCRSCPWLRHCFGGCPAERTVGDGPCRLSHLCEGYKLFFNYADGDLKKLAENWKNRQFYCGADNQII